MGYTNTRLGEIFNMTRGKCHLCGRKLDFGSYALAGGRGRWEVDHGNPRSRRGVNDLRNLKPACVSCNRSKGDLTTAEYRQMMAASAGDSELEMIFKLFLGALLFNALVQGSKNSQYRR